jgi:hypothetical protein
LIYEFAGKLFGVAEKELDLETQYVAFQNPLPVFFGVGAEVKFVALYEPSALIHQAEIGLEPSAHVPSLRVLYRAICLKLARRGRVSSKGKVVCKIRRRMTPFPANLPIIA